MGQKAVLGSKNEELLPQVGLPRSTHRCHYRRKYLVKRKITKRHRGILKDASEFGSKSGRLSVCVEKML